MNRALLTVHKFYPNHRAGTETLTLKVAQELISRGWDVLVVAGNSPDCHAQDGGGYLTSDHKVEGVNVHVVEESLRLRGYTFRHEYCHPAIKEHFQDILLQFKPDIVHAFHVQNLSASILEAACDSSIPVVLSATDFWFVCPTVQLKRSDGLMCRGPRLGASNCLACYTPKLFPDAEELASACANKYPLLYESLQRLPHKAQKLALGSLQVAYVGVKLPSAIEATVERPLWLRKIANRLRAIMVPTRLMYDIFLENGIDAQLLYHVPFGVDTSKLVCHQNKTSSEILRIGFIGTLFEHKGVDLLIKAFQSLPSDAKASLKLYGDLKQFPDYANMLIALVQGDRTNADKISFAGTFPNEKLGEILSEIDVLVVPSRWYENTPLVIQSALATKTPVIATDLGGMSELIKHGNNGLLFELNDWRSLRTQLLMLLQEPTIVAQLRDNIVPERTTAQMVDEIETIYQTVFKAGHHLEQPASVKKELLNVIPYETKAKADL